MDQTEKEVGFCKEFLKRQYFTKNLCRTMTSRNWKHVVEELYSDGYVSMYAFNKAAREIGFNLQKRDTSNDLDDCYININPKKTVFYTDVPEKYQR